jgi:uncharacterized protein YjaZ
VQDNLRQPLAALEWFETANAWNDSVTALERAVKLLEPEAHGIKLPAIHFAFVLGNPDMLDVRTDMYTGVGNVPGWALLLAYPTDFNLPRLSAVTVHEFHHNIRFALEPLFPAVNLGKYIVAEGLAEAFAAHFFGEDMLGRWTTTLQNTELEPLKPRFHAALLEPDFNVVRGFIFGDWAAKQWGFEAQGIPDFAGYAFGYQLVKAYLEHTGKSIVEATYTPWQDIVEESGYFK